MKHFKILTILLFSFLFLTACESQGQTSESETKEISVTNQTIQKTYKLKGFKQSCCSGIVDYALKEVDGFIKSKANVKKQELTVWFNASKCSEKDIKHAINKTPYKIVEKE